MQNVAFRERDKPRQGVEANTLKLFRQGDVGFIGWLDLKLDLTQNDIRLRTVRYLLLKIDDDVTMNAALGFCCFGLSDYFVSSRCVERIADNDVWMTVSICRPTDVNRWIVLVNGVGYDVALVHDVSINLFAVRDPSGEQKRRSERDADKRDRYRNDR